MSNQSLTPFSYVVLTLVGQGGAGPHDLVRMARSGRIYWDAADSQWYAEPKRLETLGHLSSRKEPGRTRPRTHYTLTDKGRDALAEWMQEPARFPRIQHEAVVRLLSARLDAAEAIATTIPSREHYLLLNHRLARRIVKAHTDWLDEVERELR